MGITTLQHVIQPEIFTPYVIRRTMELSAVVQSGIVVNNSEFDMLASGPNTLANMPFWEDLQGEEETVKQGGFYDPKNINANKDVARKQMFGNMWGADALTALLSGADPMAAIGDLVSTYWQRIIQARLLAVLDGIFAATTMADKVHDISALLGDDGLLTGESFIDAGQKMGDAKNLLTAVLMHSAVEAYLAKRKLIEYVQEYEQSPRVPYFMGKRVVVDDAMYYDTTTKTGAMHIFGSGAIAMGNGSHPRILETELDRDSTSHAGEDYLVNRRIIILHPRGVKFTENSVEDEFSTRAELKDGTNWERVYEPKAIRIVKFIFRIGSENLSNAESRV
ncbi:MAG: major capsid protein [Defluviitaleaceae bacterium]|nr:major capsid protein [Defluviitaleaceae bacterium]MCL2273433.1 major capsid protein [Defluviitaleaceae bacterium]